jgi:phospholipase/carboxylesterase
VVEPGLWPLDLDEGRDGLLYVPKTYHPGQQTPLILSLHGARGNEQRGIALLRDFADEYGMLVLAPASRGDSWDALLDTFGPDIDYIDRALARTFDLCAADPTRLAVGGFSDGASYALSIGLPNGDLFTHILAFSPGFAPPLVRRGAPKIYISHGTRDGVLPIDVCSRTIVPMVRDAGYDVTYHEFDGPHAVPPEIAREGLDWFLAR